MCFAGGQGGGSQLMTLIRAWPTGLAFVPLGSALPLVQCFLPVPLFSFRMVIYTSCGIILSKYVIFLFTVQGLQLRYCLESRKRPGLWTHGRGGRGEARGAEKLYSSLKTVWKIFKRNKKEKTVKHNGDFWSWAECILHFYIPMSLWRPGRGTWWLKFFRVGNLCFCFTWVSPFSWITDYAKYVIPD